VFRLGESEQRSWLGGVDKVEGYLKLLTVLDRTVVPMESTEGLHGLKEARAGDRVRAEGSSQPIDL